MTERDMDIIDQLETLEGKQAGSVALEATAKEARVEIARLRAEVEQLETHNDRLISQGHDLTELLDEQAHAIEQLESKNKRLLASIERLLIAGNHIATYSAAWPDYRLDGLTRDQQCEHALRSLGAGVRYDMWCCWSAIMQERDALGVLEQKEPKP